MRPAKDYVIMSVPDSTGVHDEASWDRRIVPIPPTMTIASSPKATTIAIYHIFS
jgi:hypothetical protein